MLVKKSLRVISLALKTVCMGRLDKTEKLTASVLMSDHLLDQVRGTIYVLTIASKLTIFNFIEYCFFLWIATALKVLDGGGSASAAPEGGNDLMNSTLGMNVC